ncbi:MAG: hypothetical protein LBQ60_10915, partial [Bacteroidales bacterium]|nr:hypothetical protein [Bacteroidales bacterium]
AIENFGNSLPQEKVYLHFDNTSYYQGDHIWFQCYTVTSGLNRPTQLSKTLYVELLNPGGEIIAKQVLPIRNGRCHGDFPLNHLPFYSGFYEIRAYTKYMLNFGEETIFSRIFPVFDQPQEAGNFEEKSIQKYTVYKYPQKRESVKKAKKVNLKFYPEGGNLIEGVPSHVAFEATDAYGNPLELSGTVLDKGKNEILSFATTHNGRGVFIYTPAEKGSQAIVNLDDKKYRFDLPDPIPQGFVMHVDNLSSKDSLFVMVRRNDRTPAEELGLAVISRGNIFYYYQLDLEKSKVRFGIDKNDLPAGVSQVVLFDIAGRIVADRLVFAHNQVEQLSIHVRAEKETYQPFEPVELNFSIRNQSDKPVCTPLSVSVRDGMAEVEGRHTILTDLLLMSEIKGYVRHPSYYFESDDYEHRSALDQLLMVQGWRRYSWEYWSGTKPFELKYLPEQAIEVHGKVVTIGRRKPVPDVQVSSFLAKRGEDEASGNTYIDIFDTDSMGRFAFLSDITGKWNLVLSVTDKGKKKDHQIVLDRVFSPSPAKYQLAEMQVNVVGSDGTGEAYGSPVDADTTENFDYEKFIRAYEDSLKRLRMDEKVHHIEEVVVKAKKRSREKDIFDNRSKSIAYYDVASEIDDIRDNGKYINKDINDLLVSMNPDFRRSISRGEEYVTYKGRAPLFVINYVPTMRSSILDSIQHTILSLESIKSIYINEEIGIMNKYADPNIRGIDINKIYGCVVFIETHPEGKIPAKAGKGVRKTWLDGYSEVKEFYQPDYSALPKEEDYRRTLYWNPELIPDEEGNAKILFYNNSRCKKMKVSVETISTEGTIGSVHL